MSNKNLIETEERIKHTERLNQLVAEGTDYETILKQSQILDEYIVRELKRSLNTWMWRIDKRFV